MLDSKAGCGIYRCEKSCHMAYNRRFRSKATRASQRLGNAHAASHSTFGKTQSRPAVYCHQARSSTDALQEMLEIRITPHDASEEVLVVFLKWI